MAKKSASSTQQTGGGLDLLTRPLPTKSKSALLKNLTVGPVKRLAGRNAATGEFVKVTAGKKTERIAARVNPTLVKAARARVGNVSDTEVIELALMALATADDFAVRFLALKGTVPQDIDLEL